MTSDDGPPARVQWGARFSTGIMRYVTCTTVMRTGTTPLLGDESIYSIDGFHD